MKLKIAIVVHGRFHAFDLTRALLERGHDVTLFTNYPKWAVAKFGIPKNRIRSFWLHGIFFRFFWWANQNLGFPYPEVWLHSSFGNWAAEQINREKWDVVHAWSGISEEIRRRPEASKHRRLKLLMRGSSHIRSQARLLEEEEKRTGEKLDRPSPWMIAREEREYALADNVVVLSAFAYNSFIAEGVVPEKLCLLPLGVSTESFRPSAQIVEERCRRILSGEPLRVLYVGALSFRKGIWDMAAIVHRLGGKSFQFRLVGPIPRETKEQVRELRYFVEFVPKQSQHKLQQYYAWGDLFVFPTLEDGFAQVLAQAEASALPILTTTNCSGPDFIREGETGWVLPIRSPGAFLERLRWCDTHRDELARMVRRIYEDFKLRDWSDVAADFEKICLRSGFLSRSRR